MFGNTKTVIYISRTTIEVAKVQIGATAHIKERFATAWTDENLTQILTSLLQKFKTTKVLLLLADNLSYTMTLTIPAETTIQEQRSLIFQKVQLNIPEKLEDADWDYKELGLNKGEKTIIAFAPVLDVFRLIEKELQDLSCTVEAIEPEAVAKSRNADPIIGIALKKDMKGKDEEVLNISLRGPHPDSTADKQASELKPKMNGRTYILLAFLILTIIGASVFFLMEPGGTHNTLPATVPTIFPTKVPPPTITPAPDKKLAFSDYSVQVLNGSETAGEARRVADLLEDSGFENIKTGNATNSAFIDTVIQVKTSTDSAQLTKQAEKILNEYRIDVQSPLTEDNEFDLLIIVGRKK